MWIHRKFIAVVMSVCVGVAVSVHFAVADQPSVPTVSKSVAKQLKAAQDAIGQKEYDEALTHLKEAQAVPGARTAYDNYVFNALRIRIYEGRDDVADLIPPLASAAQSPYATAEEKKAWYRYIAEYEFQQKDYSKALDAAQQAVQLGATDSDTILLIAKAQYQRGKYKEAALQLQEAVNRQVRPDEDTLKLLWQFDLQANDEAGAAKAIEKLAALYPKPQYWHGEKEERIRQRIGETQPRRRDSPLRYLNISDDEVRQIQLAVAAVEPQEFVSIGGVVTGCPVEEGPGCTDQVWVDLHRPDKTVGLLLSKVNDQWVIGVIQRWWLCNHDLDAHRERFSSYSAYWAAKDELINHFPSCVAQTLVSAQP